MNRINNIPELITIGAQPAGSPIDPNSMAAISVTGTLQDRPTGVAHQAQLFKVIVSAAAAVVLTCGPGTTSRWVAGDQIVFRHTTALSAIFTAQDATGPTSVGRMSIAATFGSLTIRFNGGNWEYVSGGD